VNNNGKLETVTPDYSIVDDYMSQQDVPFNVCWQISGTLNVTLKGIITIGL
jgi:hypothetical protein